MKRTKFLLSALLSMSLTSCSINSILSGILNKPNEDQIVECKHSFNVNEIEPTCTEKGKKVYTCELCNYSYSIDTPALGHDISDVYTYNNEYHYKTCSRCDEAFEKQDHIFVNGICVCGYSIVSEGLKYSLNKDGQSYSVTGLGECTETDIVIPSEYNGLPVTSIGSDAFSGCRSLTSIVIPNSVTSIGSDAFYNCSSLTSIVIPNSVTSIGLEAFYGCSSLTSIVIPNSVTSIGSYAFGGCSSLSSIQVDSNNPVYDSRDNCNAIIETNANTLIQGCKSTIIPCGVTSIGYSAFRNCSSLTSIIIPNSITSIYDGAFYNCSSLTSVVIPNSITSIGSFVFTYCSSLTSIVIPNSVTSIDFEAFFGCSSLTSIVIPNSVTSIDLTAFRNCSSLSSIQVDSNNPVYDSRDNCNAIIETNENTLIQGCKSTIIPYGVTSIGYSAFFLCSSLTSIVIPNSITSIYDGAFSGCSSLTSIVIPNSVTSIGYIAFDHCSSLTIYCEAESKPSGWDSDWNNDNRPVIWGYTPE